jgi:hypothetical protein
MRAADPARPPPAPLARRQRWWIGATLVLLVLVAYVAAVTWTTRRLEADIQKSIHALPEVSGGVGAHRTGD